jgi:hypothetical protein
MSTNPVFSHFINYDDAPLVQVDITDPDKAAPVIKEMVEFWSGYERHLEEFRGEYEHAFCKRLALFCLENGRLPRDADEGWYPLDGRHGIKARDLYPFDWINEDLIEIS